MIGGAETTKRMTHETSGQPRAAPSTSGTEMISFTDVEKTYGRGEPGETVTALENINLQVEEGEFVSVVGPSGCGKTTLLHLAAGILEPTAGSVKIDGVDVQSPDHKRKEVGLVFQQPVALEWRTVHQNLMLPAQILKENGELEHGMDYYEDRADDLLSLTGLEGFGDSYPNELSGGMQQRVTISQALIYEPSVLLMDEPFGSLDAMTKDELNLELLRIWRETEKTILFITHDLDEAVFLSDRIIVLSPRPGRIVDEIEIDLPRPRNENTRGTERFVELSAETHQHFKSLK
jgi:NitT/TauT family transport system ATP-binding protein